MNYKPNCPNYTIADAFGLCLLMFTQAAKQEFLCCIDANFMFQMFMKHLLTHNNEIGTPVCITMMRMKRNVKPIYNLEYTHIKKKPTCHHPLKMN